MTMLLGNVELWPERPRYLQSIVQTLLPAIVAIQICI